MNPNRKVRVVDYDPAWPQMFRDIQKVLALALVKYSPEVIHVGSTSVPGLAAKAVIDIDIVPRKPTDIEGITGLLQDLGYEHLGDLGIPQREAFRRNDDFVPADGNGREWPGHNLYVCAPDSVSLRNHITLKEYLINHPEKMREYTDLKKKLASMFPNNMDAYIEGKTSFITNILQEQGFRDDEIAGIVEVNKAK